MMRFARYPASDGTAGWAFINSDSPEHLRFVHISSDVWNNLKNPHEIAVIDAKIEIPDSWYSVWRGVKGGRWMEIAVVDSLQTAQALLNTMPTGKITHADVQIEIKNPHLND